MVSSYGCGIVTLTFAFLYFGRFHFQKMWSQGSASATPSIVNVVNYEMMPLNKTWICDGSGGKLVREGFYCFEWLR